MVNLALHQKLILSFGNGPIFSLEEDHILLPFNANSLPYVIIFNRVMNCETVFEKKLAWIFGLVLSICLVYLPDG